MEFLNFLTMNFNVDTIVIAMVISVISILIELIFKDKMPSPINTVLPFFLGSIFCLIYKLIIKEKPSVFSVISYGITAGSLSFVIKAFISSLKNKSNCKDAIYLAVKEILNDYYKNEKLENATKILTDYIKNFENGKNNLSFYEGLMLNLKNFDGELNDFYATMICVSLEQTFNSLTTK